MRQHELGHTQQRQAPEFQYAGETEAIVNFLWVYVHHVKFGVVSPCFWSSSPQTSGFSTHASGHHLLLTPPSPLQEFNEAFRTSFGGNYEPDDAAVHWMITPNFREGNEMDRSHTPLDEYRYHGGARTGTRQQ